VVARLDAALRGVLAQPEVVRQMLGAAFLPAAPGTPEALGAHLRAEIAKWGGVMRAAGIEQQ
jgi:tripartite-type tricarboxylate transporter receptor subunit TctC